MSNPRPASVVHDPALDPPTDKAIDRPPFSPGLVLPVVDAAGAAVGTARVVCVAADSDDPAALYVVFATPTELGVEPLAEVQARGALLDVPPFSRPVGGVWTHYKGGLYTVLAVARQAGEREPWIVYYSISRGVWWVRREAAWESPAPGGGRRYRRVWQS